MNTVTEMGTEDTSLIKNLTDRHTAYEFYGVWSNYFKLGNLIFKAIEDEADGYRSYLDSIAIMSDSEVAQDLKNKFRRRPLAKVYIHTEGDEVDIVDVETNHVWLSIYTDNTDDYYPSFCFDYKIPEVETYNEEVQGLSPEIISAEYFL